MEFGQFGTMHGSHCRSSAGQHASLGIIIRILQSLLGVTVVLCPFH